MSLFSNIISKDIIDIKLKNVSIPHSNLFKLKNEGCSFFYLTMVINTSKNIQKIELKKPKYMEWNDFAYTATYSIKYSIDKKVLKTKNQFKIEIKNPVLPSSLFESIYENLKHKNNEECSNDLLQDYPVGTYEWWLPFECKICGKKYFCECFEKSIKIYQKKLDGVRGPGTFESNFIETTKEMQIKPNICHFCTDRIPKHIYCHSMYGSKIKTIYGAYIDNLKIKETISDRDAENKIREDLNYPKIGEKWINETYLYNIIRLIFSEFSVLREASPDWLNKQRLDIFIPELSLAIEYQGEQHFKPVTIFGGEEGFKRNKERDLLKKKLCLKNKVKLIYFNYNEELTEENVMKKLKSFI